MFQKTTLTPIVVATLLLLGGCKSSGAEKVEGTSTRLETFQGSVNKLKAEVNGAADALESLVAAGAADPKPSYKEFTKRVGAVDASTKSARAGLEKTRTSGVKLFEEWTARLETIADEDIRAASEKRRDRLQEELQEMSTLATETLNELDGFVALSNDLDTYLSQDMTPAGIESIAGKSKTLSKDAAKISESLDELSAAAGKTASAFATAKPPPPPADKKS